MASRHVCRRSRAGSALARERGLCCEGGVMIAELLRRIFAAPELPTMSMAPPPPGATITFDLVFERLIGHEGKFTDVRGDRGNWTSGRVGAGELKGTKYGISAMSYPHLDIKAITLEQAKD